MILGTDVNKDILDNFNLLKQSRTSGKHDERFIEPRQ
jgi:hypothetical protein